MYIHNTYLYVTRSSFGRIFGKIFVASRSVVTLYISRLLAATGPIGPGARAAVVVSWSPWPRMHEPTGKHERSYGNGGEAVTDDGRVGGISRAGGSRA